MPGFRKYTRLIHHDYSGADYFVTVCTQNRLHYFGEIVNDDMILSEIGKLLTDNLENISKHLSDIEIPLFVVMPNHFHAIISIHSPLVGSRPVLLRKR